MKRIARLTLIGAALVTAPVAAHDATPRCDALEDGLSMRTGIDSNIDFDGDDLHFRDNGESIMKITAARELYLRGERVELDARGQVLVSRYYDTVDAFVDDAVDLGTDAAGLGISAAMGALKAVFSSEEERDRFEKRMEERAKEIRMHADSMCARFQEIESIELEMQETVPGFEPVMFAARDTR